MAYVAFIVSAVEKMVSERADNVSSAIMVDVNVTQRGESRDSCVCRVRVRKFSPTYFCACFSLLCLVKAPLVVNVRLPLPSWDGHNGHENTSPGLRRRLGPSLALSFAAPFLEGAFSLGFPSDLEAVALEATFGVPLTPFLASS